MIAGHATELLTNTNGDLYPKLVKIETNKFGQRRYWIRCNECNRVIACDNKVPFIGQRDFHSVHR